MPDDYLYYKTIESLTNMIDYKQTQLCALNNMKNLLVNLNVVLNNSIISDNPFCYRQISQEIIDQYIVIASKTHCELDIAFCQEELYGAIADYKHGFGGIKNCRDIYGRFIYDLHNEDVYVDFCKKNSVMELSDNIKKNNVKNVAIVDGLEMSILFCGKNIKFVIDVEGKSCTIDICRYDTVDEPINLLKNIYGKYINQIWADKKKPKIKIIFNRGYNVSVYNDNCSDGYLEIKTYVNGTKCGYRYLKRNKKCTLYGYLLFFKLANPIELKYPCGALKHSVVCMQKINKCGQYVHTFKLPDIWSEQFKTISTLLVKNTDLTSMRNDTSSNINCKYNHIEIKAFNSYKNILKKMMHEIHFVKSGYDNWRRLNVMCNIDHIIRTFEDIYAILCNQKRLLEVIKKDYRTM